MKNLTVPYKIYLYVARRNPLSITNGRDKMRNKNNSVLKSISFTLTLFMFFNIIGVQISFANNNTSEIYMMINQGGAQGMITMEQDLLRLFMQRKITKENAVAYANNKTRILQLLKAA